MTLVNKFKINVNRLLTGTTATTVTIPINMEYQTVDQAEVVDRVFVQTEVEKSINPIFDYEKVRLIPVLSTGNTSNQVSTLKYNLTFNDGASTYSSIGFTDDDIRFQKNSFKESFLRLQFYDSDNALEQRLISITTLYPKLTTIDLQPINSPNPGLPKPANQISIEFRLSNPILYPEAYSEGYHLYEYKDTIPPVVGKYLYMRASFNNAKTGKSTNLMIDPNAYPIDQLVDKLYTRYVLVKDNTGFYYEIDKTYSNNIIYNNKDVTVNLYQIQAL